jgi:hypothetical protein
MAKESNKMNLHVLKGLHVKIMSDATRKIYIKNPLVQTFKRNKEEAYLYIVH